MNMKCVTLLATVVAVVSALPNRFDDAQRNQVPDLGVKVPVPSRELLPPLPPGEDTGPFYHLYDTNGQPIIPEEQAIDIAAASDDASRVRRQAVSKSVVVSGGIGGATTSSASSSSSGLSNDAAVANLGIAIGKGIGGIFDIVNAGLAGFADISKSFNGAVAVHKTYGVAGTNAVQPSPQPPPPPPPQQAPVARPPPAFFGFTKNIGVGGGVSSSPPQQLPQQPQQQQQQFYFPALFGLNIRKGFGFGSAGYAPPPPQQQPPPPAVFGINVNKGVGFGAGAAVNSAPPPAFGINVNKVVGVSAQASSDSNASAVKPSTLPTVDKPTKPTAVLGDDLATAASTYDNTVNSDTTSTDVNGSQPGIVPLFWFSLAKRFPNSRVRFGNHFGYNQQQGYGNYNPGYGGNFGAGYGNNPNGAVGGGFNFPQQGYGGGTSFASSSSSANAGAGAGIGAPDCAGCGVEDAGGLGARMGEGIGGGVNFASASAGPGGQSFVQSSSSVSKDGGPPQEVTVRLASNGKQGVKGVYAATGTNIDDTGKVTTYKDSGYIQ